MTAFFAAGFSQKKIPGELDAIVIGSGIGGMSSAAILAKTGKKVLVLEQHDQAGGCCHTFVEKGYEFDVGEFSTYDILLLVLPVHLPVLTCNKGLLSCVL
mgnify:CR=1 FL=1